MSQIRVSVFSDDPFIRDGLRKLIHEAPSITFVDGDSGSHDNGGVMVDVLLVDSRTDGVLEYFADRSTDGPRLIFLFVPNDVWATDALSIGARGVIRKEDAITDVIRAVPAVQEGRVWAPRHVVVDAWLRQSQGTVSNPRVAMLEKGLSARERQVARCVAAGMSNKELAEHLAISPATVKAHLTHIFEKLGVTRRTEVIAAYHGGSIAPPRKSPARLNRPA